jgi:4-hydroxy-3-methylbut-2-enyl diphosphate reductase
LVKRVVDQLREWGGTTAIETTGEQENVVFSLPRELRVMVR